MSETYSHRNAKTRGLSDSRTEVPIVGNRRLDARDSSVVREVERSGTQHGLAKAVRRLAMQNNRQRELVVPERNLDLAKKVAESTTHKRILVKISSGLKRRLANY